jgi:hypothetical protein
MKSHVMAAVIGSALLVGAPILAPSASAQPAPVTSSSGGYLVPVVIGAAAGATVGAFLWPALVPAGAAAAAPVEWGWGSYLTTSGGVGAVLGGFFGYAAAR